jgi:hypothetical protein
MSKVNGTVKPVTELLSMLPVESNVAFLPRHVPVGDTILTEPVAEIHYH